jgi:VanZ family protein
VFAALWPFNPFPHNQVGWLSNENGLRFGRDAMVYGLRGFDSDPSNEEAFCSLEIWLEPAISNVESTKTILAFYAPHNPTKFRLLQYHDEFLVQRDFRNQQNQLSTAEIKVSQAFRNRGRVLFSISANKKGTSVYQNGQFSESYSRFGMTCESLSGQLIIGNSPIAYDSWQGNVFGLAFYRQGLTPEQVMYHSETWNHGSGPGDLQKDGLFGFYPFSERGGRSIHDSFGERSDLYIPSTFAIPHKQFLTAPWKEFSPSLGYLWDIFINIAGFVPFGFFFCAYFNCKRLGNRAAVLSLALGGFVSFAFEVLQGLLPTRSSGVTDIITNTLGTGIGVLLVRCRLLQKLVARLE